MPGIEDAYGHRIQHLYQRPHPEWQCIYCGMRHPDQDDFAGEECSAQRRDGAELKLVADGGVSVDSGCAHQTTRRYGRTDDAGHAVIEERCSLCGATLSVGRASGR